MSTETDIPLELSPEEAEIQSEKKQEQKQRRVWIAVTVCCSLMFAAFLGLSAYLLLDYFHYRALQSELTVRIEHLQETEKSLLESCQKWEFEKDAIESQRTELTGNLDQISARLKDQQEKLKQQAAETDSLSSIYTNVQVSVAALKERESSLSTSISEKSNQKSALEKEIETLSSRQSQMNAEINAAEEKLGSCEASLQKTTLSVKTLQAEESSLKESISSKTTELSAIQEKVSQEKSNAATLVERSENLQKLIGSLQKTKASLDSDVTTLSTKKESLQTSLQAVEQSIRIQTPQEAELKNQVVEVKGVYIAATNRLQFVKTVLQTTIEARKQAELELQTISAEKAIATQELQSSKDEKNQIERSIAQLKTTQKTEQEALLKIQKEVDSLRVTESRLAEAISAKEKALKKISAP